MENGALFAAGRNVCDGFVSERRSADCFGIFLYPVHVNNFQRRDWAEQCDSVLESAVDVYKVINLYQYRESALKVSKSFFHLVLCTQISGCKGFLSVSAVRIRHLFVINARMNITIGRILVELVSNEVPVVSL